MIDVILIVIVAGFVFFGLFFGFIHTLGSLVGSIVAIIVTSRLLGPISESVGPVFGTGVVTKISLVFILFFLISRVIGLGFYFVDKLLNVIQFIPFVKSINRLLGGILGFLEGIIVVGIGVFYIGQLVPLEAVQTALMESSVASWLLSTTKLLALLLPEHLREII